MILNINNKVIFRIRVILETKQIVINIIKIFRIKKLTTYHFLKTIILPIMINTNKSS